MQGGEAIDGLLGRGGDDEIGRRHDSHGTASWFGNGSILRRATGGPPVPTQPAGTAGRQLLGLELGHPGAKHARPVTSLPACLSARPAGRRPRRALPGHPRRAPGGSWCCAARDSRWKASISRTSSASASAATSMAGSAGADQRAGFRPGAGQHECQLRQRHAPPAWLRATPQSGQTLLRETLFQRVATARRRQTWRQDPALIGTWVYEQMTNSEGLEYASLTTVTTLRIAPTAASNNGAAAWLAAANGS